MTLWPWHKDGKQKVAALEEEVRAERGNLALAIVNFERADNALDVLVRRHLQLLRGDNPSDAPH